MVSQAGMSPSSSPAPMEHPRRCKAKNRRGERCGRYASPGFQVCVNHGGHSLVGEANPAFKHGRYSRLKPRGLKERFERLQQDPELMSLRSDITLVDARIEELLDQLTPGPEPWTSPVWREIFGLLGERRLLVAQEAATVLKMRGMVPVEEVGVFVHQIVEATRAAIPDSANWRRLVAEIYRLMDRPVPAELEAPPEEDHA